MKARQQSRPSDTVIARVPPVPPVIRYYDNFSDSYSEVTQADTSERWTISFDGRPGTFDFTKFDPTIRTTVQSWCATTLATLSPRTTEYYFHGLKQVSAEIVSEVLSSNPHNIRSVWKRLRAGQITYQSFEALKSLLHFCVKFAIGSWGSQWTDLVSDLTLPKVDKYASVRMGDVFLSTDEESAIVRHIDNVCTEIDLNPAEVSDDLLELTAILVCSYQFGLRAKQIAMLEMKNIRIWNDGLGKYPAVHLTFVMIKQQSTDAVFDMVRRLKRQWVPLFTELHRRARVSGMAGVDHIFRRSSGEMSKAIGDITEMILGTRRGGGAQRHSAIQRLVDAGASEEEVATFAGHTDLNTALPYFRSSASQGERINEALGVSSVYQSVVKIAHARFISPTELAALKGDQQIAGVPYGIPIAGIGGCSKGQPTCPYNPIMSCYGCNRFMPIADAGFHRQVLNDLREVMKSVYVSSRGDRGSPAFQLKETISSVQAVIRELEGTTDELLP